MDDLQLVTVVEGGPRPLIAGSDLAVQFNGNPIGLHSQLLQQAGEGQRGVKLARFAIDLKCHAGEIVAQRRDIRLF